jgi:lactate permease
MIVVLVVIGFCFGALLEGVSGFGTPVAITSSLLILVGASLFLAHSTD